MHLILSVIVRGRLINKRMVIIYEKLVAMING